MIAPLVKSPAVMGLNIKKLRELRNLNQKAMADSLMISQKTYSNIENSHNNITIEKHVAKKHSGLIKKPSRHAINNHHKIK